MTERRFVLSEHADPASRYPLLPAVVAEVLRLCAPHSHLPREQCVIPERCEDRSCTICGQLVHYDPTASIPLLGPEKIVCLECFEAMP